MTTHARGWLLPAAAVALIGCTTPATGPTTNPATTIGGAVSGMPARSSMIQGLKQPFGIAIDSDTAWVTEYAAGNLVRIDASTGRITARIHVGPHASHLVVQGGLAWVVDDLGGAITSVDTRTNQVVKSVSMRPGYDLRPIAVAAGEGSMWVALASSTEYYANPKDPPSQLVRVDPRTGELLATISMSGIAAGVAIGGGAIWMVSSLDPIGVFRIDPSMKRVAARIDTGHTPSGALAYQEPYLWVANQDGYLTRIDSRTNQVVGNFEVGSPEWPALVARGQSIWISAPLDNIVARFDPTTGSVVSTVRAGSRPQEFAFLGKDMWVANYIDGTVARLPIN